MGKSSEAKHVMHWTGWGILVISTRSDGSSWCQQIRPLPCRELWVMPWRRAGWIAWKQRSEANDLDDGRFALCEVVHTEDYRRIAARSSISWNSTRDRGINVADFDPTLRIFSISDGPATPHRSAVHKTQMIRWRRPFLSGRTSGPFFVETFLTLSPANHTPWSPKLSNARKLGMSLL